MKDFTLTEQGWQLPIVKFEYGNGLIEIKGKLMGNNSFKYFEPMYSWVKDYVKRPHPTTTVKLSIDLISTSETKHLLDLLLLLKDLPRQGKELKIMWYHHEEDEDAIEMGESYEFFTKLSFEFVEMSWTEEVYSLN